MNYVGGRPLNRCKGQQRWLHTAITGALAAGVEAWPLRTCMGALDAASCRPILCVGRAAARQDHSAARNSSIS